MSSSNDKPILGYNKKIKNNFANFLLVSSAIMALPDMAYAGRGAGEAGAPSMPAAKPTVAEDGDFSSPSTENPTKKKKKKKKKKVGSSVKPVLDHSTGLGGASSPSSSPKRAELVVPTGIRSITEKGELEGYNSVQLGSGASLILNKSLVLPSEITIGESATLQLNARVSGDAKVTINGFEADQGSIYVEIQKRNGAKKSAANPIELFGRGVSIGPSNSLDKLVFASTRPINFNATARVKQVEVQKGSVTFSEPLTTEKLTTSSGKSVTISNQESKVDNIHFNKDKSHVKIETISASPITVTSQGAGWGTLELVVPAVSQVHLGQVASDSAPLGTLILGGEGTAVLRGDVYTNNITFNGAKFTAHEGTNPTIYVIGSKHELETPEGWQWFAPENGQSGGLRWNPSTGVGASSDLASGSAASLHSTAVEKDQPSFEDLAAAVSGYLEKEIDTGSSASASSSSSAAPEDAVSAEVEELASSASSASALSPSAVRLRGSDVFSDRLSSGHGSSDFSIERPMGMGIQETIQSSDGMLEINTKPKPAARQVFIINRSVLSAILRILQSNAGVSAIREPTKELVLRSPLSVEVEKLKTALVSTKGTDDQESVELDMSQMSQEQSGLIKQFLQDYSAFLSIGSEQVMPQDQEGVAESEDEDLMGFQGFEGFGLVAEEEKEQAEFGEQQHSDSQRQGELAGQLQQYPESEDEQEEQVEQSPQVLNSEVVKEAPRAEQAWYMSESRQESAKQVFEQSQAGYNDLDILLKHMLSDSEESAMYSSELEQGSNQRLNLDQPVAKGFSETEKTVIVRAATALLDQGFEGFEETMTSLAANQTSFFGAKTVEKLLAGLVDEEILSTKSNVEKAIIFTAAVQQMEEPKRQQILSTIQSQATENIELLTKVSEETSSLIGQATQARIDNVGIMNTIAPAAGGVSSGEETGMTKGIWATGMYGNSKKGGNSGYKGNNAGGTIGFDLGVSDDSLLGVAYSRVKSGFKYKGKNNKVNADSDSFAIYGQTLLGSNVILEGLLSYTASKITTKIEKQISNNVTKIAKAKFKNRAIGGEASIGYKIPTTSSLVIVPTIGIKALAYKDQGYKETGAGIMNLEVKGSKQQARYASTLGVKLFAPQLLDGGWLVTPSLGVAVEQYFSGKKQKVQAKLAWMNNYFESKASTDSKDDFGVRTSLGLAATKGMVETSLNYNCQMEKKYVGHQGSLKLKISF